MKDNNNNGTTSYTNSTNTITTITKRQYNNFYNKKKQCLLYKNDKSSIGNIDPIVVPICTILNTNINFNNNFYTTSSCSGRSYIYTGIGNKSSSTIATSKISNNNTTNTNNIIPKSNLTKDTTTSTELQNNQPPQQQEDEDDNDQHEQDVDDEENEINNDTNNTTTTRKNNKSITESTFVRCRVLHDCINNPNEYFNLYTLEDEYQKQIHTILHNTNNSSNTDPSVDTVINDDQNITTTITTTSSTTTNNSSNSKTVLYRQWWLRYEPFILHVSCCTILYAQNLINVARIAGYKTVGITTIDIHKNKYIVSIHGDEGLDMPLTSTNTSTSTTSTSNNDITTTTIVSLVSDTLLTPIQLQDFINTRHVRNWNKMDRFLKELEKQVFIQNNDTNNFDINSCISNDSNSEDNNSSVEEDNDIDDHYNTTTTTNRNNNKNNKVPSFDVIGDVAILNTISNTGIPVVDDEDTTTTTDKNTNDNNLNSIQQSVTDYEKDIGQRILNKNNNIQWVVVRSSTLHGSNRSGTVRFVSCRQRHPQKSIAQKKNKQLSSTNTTATIPNVDDHQVQDNSQTQQQEEQQYQQHVQQLPDPFITTHKEHGISCVIDIQRTFFSVRMAPERTRLWNVIEKVEQQRIHTNDTTTTTTTVDNSNNTNNHILIVFAGVAMEAFLLVSKIPSIQSITLIEQNAYAIQCINASIRMLRGNKAVTISESNSNTFTSSSSSSSSSQKISGGEIAANKIIVLEGDVNEIIPNEQSLQRRLFQRIIAPRPKNSKQHDTITNNDHDDVNAEDEDEDGDLGTGTHGSEYLQSLLSILDIPTIIVNNNSTQDVDDDDNDPTTVATCGSSVPDHITSNVTTGIIHWYDFVSEHEYKTIPINCIRSRTFLQNQILLYDNTCSIYIITIIKAGSTVAKRQLRVCIDFIVYRKVIGSNKIVI